MNERVLRIMAKDDDAGKTKLLRLNQIIGYVNGRLHGTKTAIPFGREITGLTDDGGILQVEIDSLESFLTYGRLLVDGWHSHAESFVDFSIPGQSAPLRVRTGYTDVATSAKIAGLTTPIRR